MNRVYCLGLVRNIWINCYSCNHTTEEYLKCPKFAENASHEDDLSETESLEDRLKRWGGIMGLGEEENQDPGSICIGHYVSTTSRCDSCPIDTSNEMCINYKEVK
jgi:hypothetical protein